MALFLPESLLKKTENKIMDAFLYLVILPLFFFVMLNFVYNTITALFKGTDLKELKIPDGMKVDADVKKEGGKYRGVLKISYTQTIKIVNKPHPVEAANEDELKVKYQEIINKYIIK